MVFCWACGVRVITENLDAAAAYFNEWCHLDEPRRSEFAARRDQYEALFRGLLHGPARVLDYGCGTGRAAQWAGTVIALLSLAATVRAFLIIRQPLADILTYPAPVGFGFYLAVIGFGWIAAQNLTRLWQDGI